MIKYLALVIACVTLALSLWIDRPLEGISLIWHYDAQDIALALWPTIVLTLLIMCMIFTLLQWLTNPLITLARKQCDHAIKNAQADMQRHQAMASKAQQEKDLAYVTQRHIVEKELADEFSRLQQREHRLDQRQHKLAQRESTCAAAQRDAQQALKRYQLEYQDAKSAFDTHMAKQEKAKNNAVAAMLRHKYKRM